MKLFSCQNCGQVLYFENTACEKCHSRLGYRSEDNVLSALVEVDGAWEARGAAGRRFRFCANAAHDSCNWLLPFESQARFCRACQYNRTIPNLAVVGNALAWQKLELAKHRLFYSYQQLGLVAPTRREDPQHGLVFDFLADMQDGRKVLTGHDEGEIVLALSEADDAERERRRTVMGEPYRTLLGHFRHETGHYFWDVLVRDSRRLRACRAVFGDDDADYNAALKRHYRHGAPNDWRLHFVSAYASSHPWEDFAETWAHYLHIVDTLEMACAFDIHLHPALARNMAADIVIDPYAPGPLAPLIELWLPLTFAVNSLNRCMGAPDLYPFVLAPEVIGKLGFIHALVHGEVAQDE